LELIAMLRDWLTVEELASVTEVVKLKVPDFDGVPEISPLIVPKVRPGGNDPAAICHE
jgi:hypothetical protein